MTKIIKASKLKMGDWIVDSTNPRLSQRVVEIAHGALDNTVKLSLDFGNGGLPSTRSCHETEQLRVHPADDIRDLQDVVRREDATDTAMRQVSGARHPSLSTLEKLRADRRVECVEDARESGDGIIVSLKPGWTNDPLGGCHTFGEDTPSRALQYLRDAVVPCACSDCGTTLGNTTTKRHQPKKSLGIAMGR